MNVTAFPPKGAGLESLVTETKSCWERLRQEKRPIFIYGMGDGAVKIMSVFKQYGIPVSGIFASDEFVRGHSFAGFKVHKLSEIEENIDNFVIVLAFAAGYPELVQYIRKLSHKHTLYAPDVPVIGDGLFTYDYFLEHLQEFNQVYRMLADDESFRKEVEAKILAHMNEIDLTSGLSDEEDAKELASEALETSAPETASEPEASATIDVDAEDDFEEFDPTE